MIYAWLLRHAPQLIAGLIVAGLLAWGAVSLYDAGGTSARLACAIEREKLAKAALDDVLAAEAERDALAEKLAQRQAAPKAAPVITKVVYGNPSNCNLPAPVGDGLRDQIARANEAAR